MSWLNQIQSLLGSKDNADPSSSRGLEYIKQPGFCGEK